MDLASHGSPQEGLVDGPWLTHVVRTTDANVNLQQGDPLFFQNLEPRAVASCVAGKQMNHPPRGHQTSSHSSLHWECLQVLVPGLISEINILDQGASLGLGQRSEHRVLTHQRSEAVCPVPCPAVLMQLGLKAHRCLDSPQLQLRLQGFHLELLQLARLNLLDKLQGLGFTDEGTRTSNMGGDHSVLRVFDSEALSIPRYCTPKLLHQGS